MKTMLNIFLFLLGISSSVSYAMEKTYLDKFKDDDNWESGIDTEKLATVVEEKKTTNNKISLYEKLKQKFKTFTEKKEKASKIVIKLDSNSMGADEQGKAIFDDVLNFELTCVKTKKIEFSQGLGCYLVTLKKPMPIDELSSLLKKWNEVEGIAPAKEVNWGVIHQEREKVYNAKLQRLSKK